MIYNGWYQVAFERDLTAEVNAASIGTHPIALVRTGDTIRAVDAVCPHRGANLGLGGKFERECIVCPFHGYRIGLGREGEEGFRVREYRTLLVGGLLFVLFSEEHDNGFSDQLMALDEDHYFVPGFTIEIKVAPELVVENAFDNSHFRTVHNIRNDPRFSILPSEKGELAVTGTFALRPSPWQQAPANEALLHVPFVVRAYSPNVAVSDLGGDKPYWVITCATPTADGGSTVRLSLAMPAGAGGAPPSEEMCHYLLRQSKTGLEMDQVVWEHLIPDATPHYTAADAAVVAFQTFCDRFRVGTTV